jgi:hypothetical protein
MQKQEFEVFVTGSGSSVEEWQRAMAAPKSELPKLEKGQREIARKFGVSEEEYARGVLAGKYGEGRIRERGIELGKRIKSILDGVGSDYRLAAVRSEMLNERWLVRIVSPKKVANIAVPRDLADDVLDSGAKGELEKLRTLVLSEIGHSEFILKH